MHVTGPVIWIRCSDCEGSFYTKPSIDWRRNPLPVFVYAHSGENPSNLLTLALSCIKLTVLPCTRRTSLPPTPPSFKSSHARILCVLWIWSGCRPTLCLYCRAWLPTLVYYVVSSYCRASLPMLFPGTKTTSWVRMPLWAPSSILHTAVTPFLKIICNFSSSLWSIMVLKY